MLRAVYIIAGYLLLLPLFAGAAEPFEVRTSSNARECSSEQEAEKHLGEGEEICSPVEMRFAREPNKGAANLSLKLPVSDRKGLQTNRYNYQPVIKSPAPRNSIATSRYRRSYTDVAQVSRVCCDSSPPCCQILAMSLSA